MSDTFMRRSWQGSAALLLLLLVAAPATAAPQESDWTPWLGCWELIAETDAGEETTLEGRRLVCLERGSETAAVQMTTWVDDQVVLLQEVVADGRSRDVEEGGCSGDERARFSADGQRILLSADLRCEARPLRTSGISLLPTSSTWTDIQVSEVDDQRELLVRRYRRTDAGERLAPGADEDRRLLVRTARTSASAAIEPEDVIEALDHVDPAAVEAMLLESGDEFEVDADLLIELADAGVPENVIDLMVALSYPDYFAVHEGEGEEAWDRQRYRRGGWAWGPAFYSGYYGYYDPFFSPFGYSYYYGRPYGGTRILHGTPRFGGKVVKGRGYTRITTRQDTGGGSGLARLFGGGSRDSGRSAVGRSGDSGGRSSVGSSGRTAKPRSGSGTSGSSGRTAKPRSGGSSGAKPKPKPKSGSGSSGGF